MRLGRLGVPDDIARAIVLLAADDTAWITGQIIQGERILIYTKYRCGILE